MQARYTCMSRMTPNPYLNISETIQDTWLLYLQTINKKMIRRLRNCAIVNDLDQHWRSLSKYRSQTEIQKNFAVCGLGLESGQGTLQYCICHRLRFSLFEQICKFSRWFCFGLDTKTRRNVYNIRFTVLDYRQAGALGHDGYVLTQSTKVPPASRWRRRFSSAAADRPVSRRGVRWMSVDGRPQRAAATAARDRRRVGRGRRTTDERRRT